MKKVITSILVVCYILALVPAIIVAVTTEQGTTGDCTWKRTGTVLTISGNGKMGDYGGGSPWSDKITEVKISEGVTSIGTRAFFPCKNLNIVKIPDSVTSIGDKAFWFCDNLSEIILPDSITSIGADAFDSTAYANDEVNWNENMLYLGNYLIEINYNDSDVYNVKSSTKVIADDVFSNCKNPSSITIPSSVIHIGEGNNIVTKQTHNIDNYLHFIPLIALAGLGVGAAVFLIIRKSVKKHKSDELR